MFKEKRQESYERKVQVRLKNVPNARLLFTTRYATERVSQNARKSVYVTKLKLLRSGILLRSKENIEALRR